MSDSLKLEVTGEGRERMSDALHLCPNQRITGVTWEGGILVLSHEYDSGKPQKMTFEPVLMVDVIMDWLSRPKASNPRFATRHGRSSPT